MPTTSTFVADTVLIRRQNQLETFYTAPEFQPLFADAKGAACCITKPLLYP
jgi:hypothetical protein